MESLRQWLDRSGTSQKSFAETLGVTQAAVSQWIGGKQSPRPATLKAISQHTGLTIDELLDNAPAVEAAPARIAS